MVSEEPKIAFSDEAMEGIMEMMAEDPEAGAKLEEILAQVSTFNPEDRPEGTVAYCFVCVQWFTPDEAIAHDEAYHEHMPQIHSEQSPLFGK